MEERLHSTLDEGCGAYNLCRVETQLQGPDRGPWLQGVRCHPVQTQMHPLARVRGGQAATGCYFLPSTQGRHPFLSFSHLPQMNAAPSQRLAEPSEPLGNKPDALPPRKSHFLLDAASLQLPEVSVAPLLQTPGALSQRRLASSSILEENGSTKIKQQASTRAQESWLPGQACCTYTHSLGSGTPARHIPTAAVPTWGNIAGRLLKSHLDS